MRKLDNILGYIVFGLIGGAVVILYALHLGG